VAPDLEKIAIACVRECERQRVGLDRLAALLTGYVYAVENAGRLPNEGDALHLVGIIEPMTFGRYRRTPVTFADGGSAAGNGEVAPATARLFAALDATTDPVEFVRAFLSIHPFTDGNGRTAFVLLNWLAHTLDSPQELSPHEPRGA
jgi:hypothetical protein